MVVPFDFSAIRKAIETLEQRFEDDCYRHIENAMERNPGSKRPEPLRAVRPSFRSGGPGTFPPCGAGPPPQRISRRTKVRSAKGSAPCSRSSACPSPLR